MTKAIILDFGGVVSKDKPKEEWVGPTENLGKDPELWAKGVVGQVEDDLICQTIAHAYGVNPETIKEWLFSRRESNIELLNILAQVNPGIKKAILNNGLKTLFRGYLDKFNISDQFDALVNSAEEGVKKPDPKIYLITCQKLGVKPEDCIFIDNDLKNLDGAEAVGMKPILFTDIESLITDFTNLRLM